MVSFEFFVFRGMFYHTRAAAPDKLGLKDTVTYTIMPEGDDEAKCRKWMTVLPASRSSSRVRNQNIDTFAILKKILKCFFKKAEIFSFEKTCREQIAFRQSAIYALNHRDFMHTSRRPPRDARRFAPQSRVVHGQMAWNRMEIGIRARVQKC